MNNLAFLRKIVFTLFAVLIAAFSWGQVTSSSLSGSGTEGSPYQITSAEDWNNFASDVNGGYSYSGEFVQLTTDITVTCTNTGDNMVGTTENYFQGTFDGDNHTLAFNYNQLGLQYVAPFRYISGATIKNLNVAGEIYMSDNKKYAGGLFYENKGDNNNRSYITDCTVSITIKGNTSKYPGNSGGFASKAPYVTFTNCLYNGLLQIGSNSGGICAEGNAQTQIDYCLCAPASGSEIYSNSGTLIKRTDSKITKSYYTLLPNEKPNVTNCIVGKRAYTSEPPASPAVFTKYSKITKDNNVPFNNTYYWIEGDVVITDLCHAYTYTGSVIDVDYGLTFDEVALTENTDFTAACSPSPVNAKGTYTLTLTGNHDNGNVYYGSVSQTFEVIQGLGQGDGTAGNPYIISNASDWGIFTNMINLGVDVDKYYKLNGDITLGGDWASGGTPINTVVGSNENPDFRFKGHFDGNWKTIDIYLQRTDVKYAAPFGVIDGAVIENLKVTGKIKTNQQFAGGIAAYTYGTNTISSCISSVEIDCSDIVQYPTSSTATDKQYDCTHGGLVGQLESGTINFTNCIFNGSIVDKKLEKTARKCSGFCGYRGGKLYFTDCTMAGTINIADVKNTFFRATGSGSTTYTRAYYITPSGQGDSQGEEVTASASVPTDGIYRKYTVSTSNYYVPGGVITPNTWGETIIIDPTVTYYGWTLEKDTDYEIEYEYSETGSEPFTPVSGISADGHYRISIVGTNNYGGSYVLYNDLVVGQTTWSDLKTELAAGNATITLDRDFIDYNNEGALVVSGTIVLDLNGHTINRNRAESVADGCVIKVESGANLTINNNSSATDDGIITGGYNLGNGGGIVNKGTLTLNNVTVSNNKVKENGSIYGVGAGIYNEGTLTMNDCIIQNNEAVGGGGGVHSEKGTLTINGGEIKNNSSKNKGGGVRVKTTATITGCAIKDNLLIVIDANDGGGFYSDRGSNVTLIDCEISGNNAERWGGGIYAIGGTTTLKGCLVENNTALTSGGGIYMHSGKLYIEDYENPTTHVKKGTIIRHNTSITVGGVRIHDGTGKADSKAELYIKGNTIINDNYGDPFQKNLYIDYLTGVININGPLSGDAKIGVSKKVNDNTPNSYVMTSGLGTNNPDDGEDYFKCDNYLLYWFELNGDKEIKLNKTLYWNEVDWDNNEHLYVSGGIRYIMAPVIVSTNVTCGENINMSGQGAIFIQNGKQFVYTGTPVTVSVYKEIQKAPDASTSTATGWYTISSPVNNPNIITGTTLITSSSAPYNFDLLRYDEPSHYWESYTDNTHNGNSFTSLENGRGYLYRHTNNVTVEFTGSTNTTNNTVEYNVTNNGGNAATTLPGFNLIGNPFTHNIKLANISLSAGTFTGGYVLNQSGEWSAEIGTNDITPCQGVLIQVSDNATATISPTAGSKSRATEEYVQFTVANSKYEDVAYAMFDEGAGLNKIEHINKDIPMVYIHQNDEDYAIATMEKARKSFNLNFVAKTTGRYTLSVKPEGEFSYLHVIDMLTGEDIDMLAEKEYEFIGSATDDEERFIVRMGNVDSDNIFAYQNGSDLVVNGNGELQVFDVMGRMVMTQHINGVQTMCTSSLQTGVYILRLNGMSQKIVVK